MKVFFKNKGEIIIFLGNRKLREFVVSIFVLYEILREFLGEERRVLEVGIDVGDILKVIRI